MQGGRSLGLTAVLMLAVALSACQGPGGETVGKRRPTRLVPPEQVTLPPGLEMVQLTPLAGSALAHARQPLGEILAALPEPDYLARAREAGAGETAPSEPDVEVQRAYVRARQAWREGLNHEAIREMDAALRLAPGQPNLLRLQARAYGAIGNRLRSAMHLRQALESDPTDIEGLFILGRLALEQDEPYDAIVLFHRALEVSRETGNRTVPQAILHYHLAAALLDAGYAAAAIEEHTRYRKQAEEEDANRSTDLGMTDRQRAATWLAVGDAYHRLGNPGAALEAYERAAELGLADEPALVHRRVYTHLRLGQAEPAKELTIHRVRTSSGTPTSLNLVAYLTRQGVSPTDLAEELERIYQQEGQAGPMALAIAELLPRADAVALLKTHLAAQPADERVFEHLLDEWLLPEGAANAEPEAIQQAVMLTAPVMAHASTFGQAEDAAAHLFNAAGDLDALLSAVQAMPDADRHQPMVRVIEGMALGVVGRMDDAGAAFERAIQADASLALARLQLAKILIARHQYERAGRLLKPLEESMDNVPVLLRVHVLAETERVDEALVLLERVLRGQPQASVDLVLQKAALQVRAGDARAAERTLLDALNVRPEEERIYAVLFELYSPGSETAEQIGDWQRQWTRLVRRLLGTIPESRLGRLVRAQILDAQGQRTEAEQLLRQLLDENADDHEALQQLLELLVRDNRREDAREFLQSKLDEHPDNLLLLTVAHRFYQQIGDRQRMLDVAERMLSLEPAGPARARNLAALYLQTDRPEQAVAVLDDALAKPNLNDPMPLVRMLWRAMLHAEQPEAAQRRLAALSEALPQHAIDLLYERAMLADRLNQQDESERLLLQLLERDPDHAMANNALGYTWVTQRKNLDQAKAMIQRAVDAEPDNAAYLDSLGWVYYKLGQFEEAVVWLRRSRAADMGDYPVIVDHLGDALYRLGRHDEALRTWHDALTLLQEEDYSFYEDPELETLSDRLQQKIDALTNNADPPIAQLPEEEEPAPPTD